MTEADIVDEGDLPDDGGMDDDELAALHATGFGPRARWPAAVLMDARMLEGAIFVEAHGAFAIGRAAAGEAELHTLVVAPFLRRTGAGARLLAAFEEEARAGGAAQAFLEVAEGNAAARALYAHAGWLQTGRRRGYYAGIDALILRKGL